MRIFELVAFPFAISGLFVSEEFSLNKFPLLALFPRIRRTQAFLASALGAAGGIGGGGILVPLFTSLGGFSIHHAIPLTQACVLGASIMNFIQVHASAHRKAATRSPRATDKTKRDLILQHSLVWIMHNRGLAFRCLRHREGPPVQARQQPSAPSCPNSAEGRAEEKKEGWGRGGSGL